MEASFAFTSIHDAALQLAEVARAAKMELHPLPYRRYDPEADDTWWLAPTTANPAYADGKIAIEGPWEPTPGASMIGLHIEKGVGPSAAPIFEETARGQRLVLRDDWIWRPFVREMATGRVEQDLTAAATAAGELPLLFTIRSAIQDLPRLEEAEDRDRFKAEVLWYRPGDGYLEQAGFHQPDVLAAVLGTTETLASIAEKLGKVRDIDWRWVEIFIGIPFRRVADGGLPASEVWKRACAPWLAWVR